MEPRPLDIILGHRMYRTTHFFLSKMENYFACFGTHHSVRKTHLQDHENPEYIRGTPC